MGRKKAIVKSPGKTSASAAGSYTWRLSDHGMDLLERTGLAGLYMALRAAREVGHDLSPLEWTDNDLTADAVTVRWTGPPRLAFEKLMKWSWQVRNGLFYFPAVHTETDAWWRREATHNGLMKTYFQNPNVQPALEVVSKVIDIEEGRLIESRYKVPGERVPAPELGMNKRNMPKTKTVPTKNLRPHINTTGELFEAKDGSWKTGLVELSNWVYPGCSGRYAAEKSWFGPANLGLLLMLTPTVCLFQRLQGKGGNWVLIVPDVRDLIAFGRERRRIVLKPEFVDVASLGDAGLRFLAEYTSNDVRNKLHASCRVVAMGSATYYPKQSIRKSVLDVADRRNSVARYRLLQQAFPNHFQHINRPAAEKGPVPNGWYKLPTGRGRIADNLVNGRPWYAELFVPMPWDEQELEQQRKQSEAASSTECVWFKALTYQRSKLMKLISEDDMWDTEAEQLFVKAFWEALDSLYAQEYAATERGGTRTAQERCEQLNEDIRRALMHAKTRDLVRGAVIEIFAKAGRQKTVCAHPAAVWRLIDDPDCWRQGRDLALLALASHQKRAVRESKEAESNPTPPTEKGI